MLDFQQGIEPPYLTNTITGFGGRLRVTPDDFLVEEIPLYAPSGEGQHLYVCLTKRALTTKEVERSLQRLFDLPRGAVGFAGMKDKHAVTTQTFSLNVGHQAPHFAEEAAKRIEDALPVQVAWTKFHGNKLKAGHLLGNRFTITVREVAVPAGEALARAEAVRALIQAHGLPNYFGPQRFGTGGANVEKGRALLLGKRYVKDKWLRRFLISAYQSFLCNCYLAARVERQAFDILLDGDIAKKVDTGGIFEVDNLVVEQQRYAAQEISFTAPMFGAKMRTAQREAGALEDEIRAASGVEKDRWRKARIDGTRRLGRMLVPDLTVQASGDGDEAALSICFTLPKGSFATTVLREFMKVDLSSVQDLDE
jgi:tRNA pseudouridine13 synthase